MQLEMEAGRSDVIGPYESAGTERIGECIKPYYFY